MLTMHVIIVITEDHGLKTWDFIFQINKNMSECLFHKFTFYVIVVD